MNMKTKIAGVLLTAGLCVGFLISSAQSAQAADDAYNGGGYFSLRMTSRTELSISMKMASRRRWIM